MWLWGEGQNLGSSDYLSDNTPARDLPYLANAKSKPVSVVLAEAKAMLQAIEDSLGGERQPFQRITDAELATGMFDLTYLIEGVLVRDQPAGLS